MAKQGMKRPENSGNNSKNLNDVKAASVPEIQGRAKSGKEKARPVVTSRPTNSLKVYHTRPFSYEEDDYEERISSAYPEIDNDLARDNVENDIPYADLQDL